MAGNENIPKTLPNPRLAELKQALTNAKSVQTASEPRLDGAVSAMNGGAWVSSLADAFAQGLSAQKNAVHSACQGCVDNVQTALNNCPATVPNPAAKSEN